MNRRKFLKRIAAVAVSSVAVPTVLANKNTEDSMLLALRRARDNTRYANGRKVFTRHKMLDGRVYYTYMQNARLDQIKRLSGEYYANSSKNYLHN